PCLRCLLAHVASSSHPAQSPPQPRGADRLPSLSAATSPHHLRCVPWWDVYRTRRKCDHVLVLPVEQAQPHQYHRLQCTRVQPRLPQNDRAAMKSHPCTRSGGYVYQSFRSTPLPELELDVASSSTCP